MSSQGKTYLKFGAATVLIVFLLGYLAYTGVQDSKSYYVTISELHKMGNGATASACELREMSSRVRSSAWELTFSLP